MGPYSCRACFLVAEADGKKENNRMLVSATQEENREVNDSA